MGTQKSFTVKTADAAKTGMHGVGNGLWLLVSKTGTKSWVFRYQIAGKARSRSGRWNHSMKSPDGE